jgi:hypothetical protein
MAGIQLPFLWNRSLGVERAERGRPASDRIAALRTGGNLLSGLIRWETAV